MPCTLDPPTPQYPTTPRLTPTHPTTPAAPFPLQVLYEELRAGAQQVFFKQTMQGRLQHALLQIKASLQGRGGGGSFGECGAQAESGKEGRGA